MSGWLKNLAIAGAALIAWPVVTLAFFRWYVFLAERMLP